MTSVGSAAYLDRSAARAAGYPDVVAPPTMVAALGLRAERRLLADSAAELDLDSLPHRSLRVVTQRPVVADDLLTCRATVVERESLRGRLVIVTRIEVTAGAEPVATVWSTVVVRATI